MFSLRMDGILALLCLLVFTIFIAESVGLYALFGHGNIFLIRELGH